MLTPKQTAIPTLVRVKPGALDRLGIYARRYHFQRPVVLHSVGFEKTLVPRLRKSLDSEGLETLQMLGVSSLELDQASTISQNLPLRTDAIFGFGGGKALDVAKYVGFLAGLPYLAVPTSLSNDGFCSPQSSLTVEGQRRSLPASVPFGVVIDTAVCLQAPSVLWHAGVGDLVSKLTAVTDWKLAFHAVGTPVDDFAALLAEASVHQLAARPTFDLEGIRVLGTSLLLNGVAMSICGSSRPASGSEHLISHALDATSSRPRLHGLQVGVASYLVSLLQGRNTASIAALLETTGFWKAIAEDPLDRTEWIEAARIAPTLKTQFYTVLSSRNCLPEILHHLHSDAQLRFCFRS